MTELNTPPPCGSSYLQFRAWLARWRARIATEPGLTVAIMSMIMSACAFFFTVYSSRLELRYKELSIRPAVLFDVSTSDYSFSLKNVGLGPAVVTHLVFRFEKKCFDVSAGLDTQELVELANHLKQYFTTPFQDITAQWGEVQKFEVTGHVTVGLLGPHAVIPPSGSSRVFGFADPFATFLHQKISEQGFKIKERVVAAFHEAATKLPFGFRYCSLTGLSCQRKTLRGCPFGPHVPSPYEPN